MAFLLNRNGGLVYMTAPNLPLTHAFTTRYGGVSEGIYASLNLGENRGDREAAVRENYKILCGALGIPAAALVFSKQIHECTVRRVTRKDCHALYTQVPYEADGLITDEPDLPLIIFTADCIPILLHDPASGAVGAVHAGWRGTVMDIAGEAVRRMAEEFGTRPADVLAAIGPGIDRCCFETGGEVPEAVCALLGRDAAPFIMERNEKFLVDLKGINRRLLERAGVFSGHIEVSDECTSCLCEKYWSHRKTNGARGSQASIIVRKGF